MSDTAETIRKFNRFYLPYMRLLGNNYLGSHYSATEARIFFELYENKGCNAVHIVQAMNIDKSYLSRILRAHEKDGLILRKRDPADARVYHLYLTENGKACVEDLIRKSNEEIDRIIGNLSPGDEERLSKAMGEIEEILTKGAY